MQLKKLHKIVIYVKCCFHLSRPRHSSLLINIREVAILVMVVLCITGATHMQRTVPSRVTVASSPSLTGIVKGRVMSY